MNKWKISPERANQYETFKEDLFPKIAEMVWDLMLRGNLQAGSFSVGVMNGQTHLFVEPTGISLGDWLNQLQSNNEQGTQLIETAKHAIDRLMDIVYASHYYDTLPLHQKTHYFDTTAVHTYLSYQALSDTSLYAVSRFDEWLRLREEARRADMGELPVEEVSTKSSESMRENENSSPRHSLFENQTHKGDNETMTDKKEFIPLTDADKKQIGALIALKHREADADGKTYDYKYADFAKMSAEERRAEIERLGERFPKTDSPARTFAKKADVSLDADTEKQVKTLYGLMKNTNQPMDKGTYGKIVEMSDDDRKAEITRLQDLNKQLNPQFYQKNELQR